MKQRRAYVENSSLVHAGRCTPLKEVMELQRIPSLGEKSAVGVIYENDVSNLSVDEQLRQESKDRVRKWVQDIPDFRNFGPHEFSESPSFLSQDGTDMHASSLHESESTIRCFRIFSCFPLRGGK